ncbi:MAG: hypothetical protein NUV56_00250 [Candidatus Uhrbacteria bacterium]|nr:hypothetical protein [Candidatus Uhrbacteria bacterium]
MHDLDDDPVARRRFFKIALLVSVAFLFPLIIDQAARLVASPFIWFMERAYIPWQRAAILGLYTFMSVWWIAYILSPYFTRYIDAFFARLVAWANR